MHLGTLIRQYRDLHNMSMDDFAAKSGLSKAYISMLEKNENSRSKKPIAPSVDTIKSVADAIGKDLNVVLSLIDPDTEVTLKGCYETGKITSNLPDEISKTLELMFQLNSKGQKRIQAYANDLVESGNYTRENTLKFEDFEVPYATLPSYGSVAAGNGFAYGDDITDYKVIMATEIPPHDLTLTVKGDSMWPTIYDGDLIFVRKAYNKVNGAIYALDVDGETVVKRVHFEADRITLKSDNPDWEDRIIMGYELVNTRIIGEVVGWETPIK